LGKSSHVLPGDGIHEGGQWSRFNKLGDTPDGVHDVVIHGSPDGFARDPGFTQPVSAGELAAEIRGSGWSGQEVRLVSCQTGCGVAGQDLADELGVRVWAPTDDAWITQSGRVVVGPKPNRPTGSWLPFDPGGH